jgi:aspartyl protease family protein
MIDGDGFGRLIYLVLLLMVVAGWFFAQRRTSLNRTLQQMILWVFLFAGAVLLYSVRDDLRLAVGPDARVQVSGEQVILARATDGHYYATLGVNGESVVFVVDTGATDMVLSRSDAVRVGIDPESLDYFGRARTANGEVRTARVRLDRVQLGPFEDSRVTAWVNDGELDTSLLGMGYLQRFAKIEISGNRMILHR